jgi:ribosomal protein L36
MKVRSAVKKMCKDCYLVKRKGKLFCYCKTDPRHKQRQGLHSYINNFAPSSSLGAAAAFPSQISFLSNVVPPMAPALSCQNAFFPLRYGLGAASFFLRRI